jgi:hypothetical protein
MNYDTCHEIQRSPYMPKRRTLPKVGCRLMVDRLIRIMYAWAGLPSVRTGPVWAGPVLPPNRTNPKSSRIKPNPVEPNPVEPNREFDVVESNQIKPNHGRREHRTESNQHCTIRSKSEPNRIHRCSVRCGFGSVRWIRSNVTEYNAYQTLRRPKICYI